MAKTDYAQGKATSDLHQGSFDDFGDGTPARQVLLNKLNSFAPPKLTDTITVEYPSGEVEIYRYREGGLTGSILESVTVTYATSSKKDLVSVEVV